MKKNNSERSPRRESPRMNVDRGTFLLSSVLPAAAGNNSPLSHKDLRKASKILKNKNPLETLTVDGNEALVTELELSDEAPKMHVFAVENFSTPPSSPENNVGKGNEDSAAAPAPEWKAGQRVSAVQRECLMEALRNGEEVSEADLWSLYKSDLHLFLDRKGITFKKGENKDVLIARVLEARTRDQNLGDAAILAGVTAIEEACAVTHIKADELDDAAMFADVTAIEEAYAVTHIKADELVHAEELAQVPTPADGQPTIEVPILNVSASAHGLSHVQDTVEVVHDEAPLNLVPRMRERAPDLVDVKVGTKLFYARPAVKEHVDKVGAMLARWSAESEDLSNGFQHLDGDVETNSMIRACCGQAALKIAKKFVGIEVVRANDNLTSASVSTDPKAALKIAKKVTGIEAVRANDGLTSALVSTALHSKSAPADAVVAKPAVASQGAVVAKDGTTGVPSGNVPATTITMCVSDERAVSSSEQQRVTGEVKSASNIGKWFYGAVKFGRGEIGDINWRRGEITDNSGADFVFILRGAYSHLKKGDQVKFQVQDHVDLECKQAIHIVRESGASIPPAIPSVSNGNDGTIGVPSGNALRATTVTVLPSGGREVIRLKQQNVTGAVKTIPKRVPPAATAKAAPANQNGALPGHESMDGTVAYLSRDRGHGFIRHLGDGSDFFFWTEDVNVSAAVGDKVKFQFDAKAVKNRNHRRKAFSVTVTHVRELREEIEKCDARNDIDATKVLRGKRSQKPLRDLRDEIKPKSVPAAVASLLTVAKTSDITDAKNLEGLTALFIKFMRDHLPPPPPPPPPLASDCGGTGG